MKNKVIMLDLDGPVFNLRSTLAETYSLQRKEGRRGQWDHALVDLLCIAGKQGATIACISSKRSDPISCLQLLHNIGLREYLHAYWLVPHPGHENREQLFKAGWTENRGQLVLKWSAATRTPLADIVAIDDQPEEYVVAGSTRVTVIAASYDDGVSATGLQKLVTFLHQK
jgi:hypothetical protein